MALFKSKRETEAKQEEARAETDLEAANRVLRHELRVAKGQVGPRDVELGSFEGNCPYCKERVAGKIHQREHSDGLKVSLVSFYVCPRCGERWPYP